MTLILSGTDSSVSAPAVQGGTGGTTTGLYYPATNQLGLATNGTLALFVDGSQQVGIGATPVTWGQSKVIQIGAAGAFSSQTSSKTAEMTANGYLNSGWKYLTSGDKATLYYQYAGAHTFNATTATGSAGNAITWDAGTVINPYGVGVGGAIPSSGIGIAFPATQSASSDANTLDDYEEGTWTPTMTNATTYTTANTVGRYIKIGKMVFINGNLDISAYNNTGSTPVTVGGFPFTTESYSEIYAQGVCFQVVGFNQANMNLKFQISKGATNASLYTVTPSTSTNYSSVIPTSFGTAVVLEFSAVYISNS